MFYLVCRNAGERQALIEYLKKEDILSVFHYLSLHLSPYFKDKHDGRELKNSDRYSETLLRLPLYFNLAEEDVDFITGKIKDYYITID
jgi:dTDP-4-amino-4,6-dideoxygalactose transaminase